MENLREEYSPLKQFYFSSLVSPSSAIPSSKTEQARSYVVDEIKSVKSKTRNILEDTQLIVDIGKHNRRQLDRLDDLINSKGLGRREEKKNPSVQLLDQMNKHMKKEYIDREDIRSQLNIPQSRKSS